MDLYGDSIIDYDSKGNTLMTQEEVLQKRFEELAHKSYQNRMYTFTNFLSPSEQDLFFRMERELSYASPTLYGGMEGTERQMIRFGAKEEFGYEEEFPITCVVAEPLMLKFADALSHRDFLGALMNLGMERELLGDIIVKDRTGYIFCMRRIADYIIGNLDKVKHTHVKVYEASSLPESIQPVLVEQHLIVSSERLDAVIAKLYHVSRSQSLNLFREKKVFVNGRQCENNSYLCKEDDTISVRGYGKFVFEKIAGTTGKGRFNVQVQIYS